MTLLSQWNVNCNNGLSYNQVLDLVDVEDSGAPAVTEPVTLPEVKNFCKVDVSEDDTLIEMLITACRLECEQLTNIGFVNREVVLIQNNGNGGAYLPLGPNGAVSEVIDYETVITTAKFSGTAFKQILEPWSDRLTITYNTGYTTLPQNLKLALLECIFYRYDERKVRENAHPPIYLDLLKQVSRVW
jgi:hypothetical protein